MRSLLTKSMSGFLFAGRIRRRLFFLFLIAAGLLYFAPWLIGKTSVVESTIAKSLAGGSVEVGRKSLGWFSRVRLDDIVIRDDQGQVLVHLQSIELDKSLLSLVMNRSDLGTVQLKSPHALVENLNSSSNWERFASKLMSQPSGDSAPKCKLQISDGEVYIREGDAEPRLVIGDVQGTAELNGQSVAAEISGVAPAVNESRVGLVVSANSGNETTAAEGNVLRISAQSFPLADLQSVLRRFVGDITSTGNLSGKMDFYWAPLTRVVFRDVKIDQLRVGSEKILRQDVLQTVAAQGGLELLHDGERWLAKDVTVDLGMAKVTLGGSLPLSSVTVSGNPNDWLPQQSLKLGGSVDLAAVANMLPNALQLREQLQITSGKVDFEVSSAVDGDRWSYKADITTSNIVARRQQQEIQWRTPFKLTATIHRSGSEFNVEQLDCQSDFFSASASGNSQTGRLSANGDLERLMNQLSNFVTLQPSWRGNFQLGLAWQTAKGQFVVNGAGLSAAATPGDKSPALILTDFATKLPGGRVWQEPRIVVELAGQGSRQSGQLQLTNGQVSARSQQGLVHAQLTAPVTLAPRSLANTTGDASPAPANLAVNWPLAVSIRGDLGQWRDRLQGLLGENSPFAAVWRLNGRAEVSATGVFGPNELNIASGKVGVRNLDLGVNDYRIVEPAVECELRGKWTFQPSQCTLDDATLTTSTVSLRARDVVARFENNSMAVKARMGYRADIARVLTWLRPDGRAKTAVPATWNLRGTVLGQAEFDLSGSQLVANLSGDISDMLLASRGPPSATVPVSATNRDKVLWQERGLQYAGKLTRRGNQWLFEQVDLRGGSLAAAFNGNIVFNKGAVGIEVSGDANCDLTKLTRQLQGLVGAQLSLSGQSNSRFDLRGTIPTSTAGGSRYQSLTAATNLNWKSGKALGLTFGAASLNAKLDGGVVTLSPLAMNVGDGKVNIAPRIDLRESPMRIVVPQGQLAENIHLSPEICRGWLRYVAPLVADATQAEGKFSLAGNAVVPMASPTKMAANGQLQIHQARIGPGPLARELIWVARQVRAIAQETTGGNGKR